MIDHRATHWMLLRLACYEANPEDPEGALDELLEGFAERAVGNLSDRKVITDNEIQDEIDSLVRAYVDRNVSDAFRESGYVRRLDEAGEIVWRLPDAPR